MEDNHYSRKILPQAKNDIREILEYISEDLCNPDAASNLLTDMIEAMNTVSRFPYSCPMLKDKRLTKETEYRRIDVKNFLIVYKVVEERKEVRVMAAIYAPSDVVGRLKGRL